jgi:secondary thiamine-phosphate synthase enzyme
VIVKLNHIFLATSGNTDILDITQQVNECIRTSSLSNGLVTVFCASSTSGVTTIEFEPGVVQDLKRLFDEIVPISAKYQHDNAWHDGNGHSHVRAALIKPSITIPMSNGKMTIGTWQQIVYIDFDTRPRKREIIVQILGE